MNVTDPSARSDVPTVPVTDTLGSPSSVRNSEVISTPGAGTAPRVTVTVKAMVVSGCAAGPGPAADRFDERAGHLEASGRVGDLQLQILRVASHLPAFLALLH